MRHYHYAVTTTANVWDWVATGTMLQGIGTVVGAGAVIVAAYIGGNSFAQWRRQQLLQRHMDLAEKILTRVVQARDEIASVRGPFKDSSEFAEAFKTLEANGFKKTDFLDAKWKKLGSAQVTLHRLARYQETWTALGQLRYSAQVYFGEEVSDAILTIQRQVNRIGIDAEIYVEDDGNDSAFSKGLMSTLSRSRPKGEVDEFAKEIDDAIEVIETKLKPLLTEVATINRSEIALLAKDIAVEALNAGMGKASYLGMGRLVALAFRGGTKPKALSEPIAKGDAA